MAAMSMATLIIQLLINECFKTQICQILLVNAIA